jgi:hypothetical protein
MDACQVPHNPKVAGTNPAPATIEPVQRPRFGGASELVLGGSVRGDVDAPRRGVDGVCINAPDVMLA